MKEKIEKILKNKRLIFTILICLAFLTSVSYAMYNIVLQGQRTHTITTSKLTFSYKEPLESLDLLAYEPLTDEEGKSQEDYYEFTVKGTSDAEDVINYVIYLKEETSSKSFSSDDIKVYLTSVLNDVETVVLQPTIISELSLFKETENTKELYESSFTFTSNDLSNKEATYRLRIWLKEDFNLNDYLNKSTTDGEQNIKLDSYEYKFKVNVTTTDALPPSGDEEEPNIPNAPELATNMIPVTYDGTNWVKADSTNSNNSWYNYDNKVWANAVTVTSTNRQTYLDATAGTPISMDDINTMWVWIPRFSATTNTLDCSTLINPTAEEYPQCYQNLSDTDKQKLAGLLQSGGDTNSEESVNKLLNGEQIALGEYFFSLEQVVAAYNQYATPDSITINYDVFFSDRVVTGANGGTSGNPGAFNIDFATTNESAHDAFTFGNNEYAGIWVGKFETSHSTLSESATDNSLTCANETCENAKEITILPNVVTLTRQSVSNFFYAGRSIEQSGNLYGLVSNEIDTHMLKNNEWGAIAYLTQSIYGRCSSKLECSEIGINNNASNATGDWIILTGYGAPAGSDYQENDDEYPYIAPQPYNTTQGMDASTTGNIYGVYDMSGGVFEYVMALYTDGTNYYTTSSGFNGCSNLDCSSKVEDGLSIPNANYYNVYTTSTNYTSAGLQHALTETYYWYGNSPGFVDSEGPWFVRGGRFSNPESSGVFASSRTNDGDGYYGYGFRAVLVK